MLAEGVAFDTSTRTAYPPVKGLDRIQAIIVENWIGLSELPRRLLVLGGSYIAVKMARA